MSNRIPDDYDRSLDHEQAAAQLDAFMEDDDASNSIHLEGLDNLDVFLLIRGLEHSAQSAADAGAEDDAEQFVYLRDRVIEQVPEYKGRMDEIHDKLNETYVMDRENLTLFDRLRMAISRFF